jgi:hypothetical protein
MTLDLEAQGVVWLEQFVSLNPATIGLESASWLDVKSGKLRIVSKWTNVRQLSNLLSKRDDLLRHFLQWTAEHGKLQIFIAGIDSNQEGQLKIVVAPAGMMFIDDEDHEASQAVANFSDWFRKTTSKTFPWSDWNDELIQLQPEIWGSPVLRGSRLLGDYRVIEVSTQSPYRIVGYKGHGINSYFIYVTEEKPEVSLRLRMSFGGVYSDPEVSSEKIIKTLETVKNFLAEFQPQFSSIKLHNNISYWQMQLWYSGEIVFDSEIKNLNECFTWARAVLQVISTDQPLHKTINPSFERIWSELENFLHATITCKGNYGSRQDPDLNDLFFEAKFTAEWLHDVLPKLRKMHERDEFTDVNLTEQVFQKLETLKNSETPNYAIRQVRRILLGSVED